jgi:hypothetical protein
MHLLLNQILERLGDRAALGRIRQRHLTKVNDRPPDRSIPWEYA